MADYTLSAKGTYDGSNFNSGIDRSNKKLGNFMDTCSTMKIAVGNILANAFGKLSSAVSSSMDAAISRVDTMNNFTNVMSNMGIETTKAQKAIDILSGDALKGLPTTLDAAVSGVQRLTSANQDIEKSTDYFLAMNNAIVAGGTDAGIQQSAIEQLSQAYSKGKMDMQEWRTLQMAMPAQLNQIAKAMNMTADQLGEGLRKGTISMDDFMGTMVKLNKEGIDGFATLEQQARTATGGIATQMTNMSTAMTRSVANVIDRFNKTGAISDVLTRVTGFIDAAGKEVANFSEIVGTRFKSGMDVFFEQMDATGNPLKAFGAALQEAFKGTPIEGFMTYVGQFVASLTAQFNAARSVITGLINGLKPVGQWLVNIATQGAPFISMLIKVIPLLIAARSAVSMLPPSLAGCKTGLANLATGFKTMITSISPLHVGLMALITVLSLVAVKVMDVWQRQQDMDDATSGLVSSVKSLGDESKGAAGNLGALGGASSDTSGQVDNCVLSIDQLIEKQKQLSDTINDRFSDVNGENAALQAFADQIVDLAGKCEGSPDKVAALKAAIEGYNEIAGTSYKVTDDFSGALDVSTEKLLENAAAFKEQAKAQAARETLVDLYKQQIEAERTYQEESKKLEDTKNSMWGVVDPTAMNEAKAALDAVNESIAYMGGVYVDSSMKAQQYAQGGLSEAITKNQEFAQSLADMGLNADTVGAHLANIGFTAESMGSLTQEQFAAMAGSADMSLAQIADRCNELGIEMPSALQGALSASKAVMDAGGSEAAASWIAGMTAGQYDAIEAAANIAGQTTAQFVASAEQNGAAGIEAVLEYANGIISNSQAAADAAAGVASDAAQSAAENSDMSEAGENLAETFPQQIDVTAGNDQAQKMVQNAVDAGMAIDSSNVGLYFSLGAAGGIDINAMADKAREMVRNAEDAAKDEAKIASPSKKMIQFGRYWAQGAAVGTDEDADLMAKSTVSMVRRAYRSAKRVPIPELSPLPLGGVSALEGNSYLQSKSKVNMAEASPTVVNKTYIEGIQVDSRSELGEMIQELGWRAEIERRS